ncbi:16591_t:CDS:2, partial [Racocetra persica]
DLKGKFIIEGFPDLVSLNLGNNELEDVEIKNCPKLEEVIVSHNKLTNLEIKDCPEITDLYTSFNQLTKLDVSELKKLEILSYCCEEKDCLKKPCLCKSNAPCHCNKFSEEEKKKLDLGLPSKRENSRKFEGFESIDDFLDKNKFVDNHEITEIDISNLAKYLSFRHNKIEEIDVAFLLNLEGLYCSGNLLKKLELIDNKKMKHLNLKELYCANNCEIEISGGVILGCSGLKEITGLNTCENLIELDCAENLFKKLDIDGLKNLEFVSCKLCNLTSLEVKACSKLTYLDYSDQHLGKYFDIENSEDEDDKKTKTKLEDCPNLERLICNKEPIPESEIENFPKLRVLTVDNNDVP